MVISSSSQNKLGVWPGGVRRQGRVRWVGLGSEPHLPALPQSTLCSVGSTPELLPPPLELCCVGWEGEGSCWDPAGMREIGTLFSALEGKVGCRKLVFSLPGNCGISQELTRAWAALAEGGLGGLGWVQRLPTLEGPAHCPGPHWVQGSFSSKPSACLYAMCSCACGLQAWQSHVYRHAQVSAV